MDGPAEHTGNTGQPGAATVSASRRQMPGARVSVRRSFLLLLILSLLPLLVLGVGRAIVQVERSRAVVEARLSERAIETARWQTEVVRTARAVLTLLAAQPDVRSGGVLCDLALAKVDDGFAAFSNVSRVSADGVIACSSAQPIPKIDVTKRPWWAAAHRPGNFLIAGPGFGKVSQRLVLVTVLPLFAETGDFDGVITASIDIGWMERNLRSTPLGPDTVALVIDGDGKTLAANRPTAFGPLNVNPDPGHIGSVTDGGGRRWSYALAPLARSFDGNRALYIAYAMPEATLFSWAWWQAGFNIAQPLVAVIIVSLVIWFGTYGLVLRWLRKLHVLAKAFSEGDYRARPADFDAAPSEFRDLAAALYKMGQAVDRRDNDLRAALDRQNQLVREIHHRVKNNLQIVMSLLSLQMDRLASDEGRAAMSQTRLRISTLALVHRMLYETGEQVTMSSTKVLGGVCDLLNQALGKRSDIVVHCNFEDHQLQLDTAIPLCLWLVEAASNAWLHAFPQGRTGEIMITLAYANGEGRLDVADNGVGLDAGARPAPAARGLRILSGIAKQLGGASEITSSQATGTRVTLRYPVGSASRHEPLLTTAVA